MARYIGRRAIHAIPVLLGITLLSFALIHLVPGDPVRLMAGERAPQALIDSIRHQLHLDRPLPTQYLVFLRGAIHGDLGQSIILRRPVSSVISEALAPSGFLIGYAVLIALLLALPLGVLAALTRNRATDQIIRIGMLVAFAMPAFWLGLVLVRWLSLDLGAFPVSGYGSGFTGHLQSLTLPALTIGLFLGSLLLRTVRASLIATLESDFIEADRAHGLSEFRIVALHGLRVSLLPMITVLAISIGRLIGGAVVVEKVFDIPGLGQLLVQSIYARDFPTIQGLTLVFGLIVVCVNLLADLTYPLLDPRIRL